MSESFRVETILGRYGLSAVLSDPLMTDARIMTGLNDCIDLTLARIILHQTSGETKYPTNSAALCTCL